MTAAHSSDPVAWAARELAGCGVESARLEAQLLLALTLGATRTAVVAGLHRPLDSADRARFEALVAARCARTPLAYLRGTQEFYGLEFEVGPAVLIPRPETEMLVDFAREALTSAGAVGQRPMVADVGTGSGCIAVAVLHHAPAARGLALDISPSALTVARGNAARHAVISRLGFVRSDLLSGVASGSLNLVLSNPPYIPTGGLAGLQPEVRDAEPRSALDGGPDGLEFYRRLAPQARRCLTAGGSVAVEVGQGQAPGVADIFECAGLTDIDLRRDLAGIERVVIGRNAGYRVPGIG